MAEAPVGPSERSAPGLAEQDRDIAQARLSRLGIAAVLLTEFR